MTMLVNPQIYSYFLLSSSICFYFCSIIFSNSIYYLSSSYYSRMNYIISSYICFLCYYMLLLFSNVSVYYFSILTYSYFFLGCAGSVFSRLLGDSQHFPTLFSIAILCALCMTHTFFIYYFLLLISVSTIFIYSINQIYIF